MEKLICILMIDEVFFYFLFYFKLLLNYNKDFIILFVLIISIINIINYIIRYPKAPPHIKLLI